MLAQVSTTIPKLTRRKKSLLFAAVTLSMSAAVFAAHNDAHINNSPEDVPVVIKGVVVVA